MNKIIKRINHAWRIAATGLSFFAFGIAGLLMGLVFFPLINLFVRKPRSRASIARQIIRVLFRTFIGFMRGLRVLRYDIIGLKRLQRQGLLILANHPTLLDTVFLMAFIKDADCVVKSLLWDNAFIRGSARAAGYIRNDTGTGLLSDGIASLQQGSNLIIFPEGTRTDGPIIFKRGAANIAIRCLTNVTPVVIHCSPPTLGKGKKWWQVPLDMAHFTIEIKEDIDVRAFVAAAGNDTLAARHLTAHLQNYFRRESQSDGAA